MSPEMVGESEPNNAQVSSISQVETGVAADAVDGSIMVVDRLKAMVNQEAEDTHVSESWEDVLMADSEIDSNKDVNSREEMTLVLACLTRNVAMSTETAIGRGAEYTENRPTTLEQGYRRIHNR